VSRARGSGSAATPAESLSEGLAESLPLFVVAALLFASGYLFWRDGSTAGPNAFPLWQLLVALGAVALGGALLSWLLAAPDVDAARPSSAAAPARDGREEFGRPRPDVQRPGPTPAPTGGLATAMSSYGPPPRAIWSEDDLPLPPPRPALRPSPVRTGPERATTSNEGVNLVLAELDEIERDVTPRRRGPGAAAFP